jgi:hypothetical protein
LRIKTYCTYLASDGKEFKTEQQCKEYEESLVQQERDTHYFLLDMMPKIENDELTYQKQVVLKFTADKEQLKYITPLAIAQHYCSSEIGPVVMTVDKNVIVPRWKLSGVAKEHASDKKVYDITSYVFIDKSTLNLYDVLANEMLSDPRRWF